MNFISLTVLCIVFFYFYIGLPEVTLTGMKADIKVQLQNLGNSVYRAIYTPTVPGAYLLNVMWSDR